MASIGDLGTGLGYFYVVDVDGTTILKTFENEAANTRILKIYGVEAASLGLNRRAIGSIEITVAPSGAGAVSAVTVNGVQQMLASVNYSGATSASGLATAVAAEINNFTPASGANYTAIAVNEFIYILAPISSGAAVNGHAIAMTVSTNPPTFTTVAMAGGSNANTVYDQTVGYRFFINADYDSSGYPGQGTAAEDNLTNAVEITDYIVVRGLQSAFNIQAATISAGVVSFSRTSAITHVVVDTEGAAATDDLEYITPNSDFANGDIVYLYGTSASRVITITGTKNIVINGTFSTGALQVNIAVAYSNGTWYEIGRSGSGVPSVTLFRAAKFPFLSETAYGKTTIAPADNTTVTLTVNSSTKYQRVSGSATLSTGDYTIDVDTTGATEGDEFIVEYDGTVTIGGQAVKVGGYTLTSNEALVGGLVFKCYFNGTTWDVTRYYDFAQYTLETANIGANQVTVAKLEAALTYELIVVDVSFETSELGDYKIKIPFACTLNEFYARATKTIAGTDNATITPKNNGGTTLTGGTITFTAADAFGTAYTTTPTANNTFVAGDLLTLTTAKTTAGGRSQVSIKVTRT